MYLVWQADCLLCSDTYVLGSSMDGLIRHVCMEKHLKQWVANNDSPPEMTELRRSLAEKWVAYTRDPERASYISKRTQVKEAGNKRVRVAARMQAIQALTCVNGAGSPTGRLSLPSPQGMPRRLGQGLLRR